MFEILQSLSRAVLALLSGAMLIFGFFFFLDWASGVDPSSKDGYGHVWTAIRAMVDGRTRCMSSCRSRLLLLTSLGSSTSPFRAYFLVGSGRIPKMICCSSARSKRFKNHSS